jgi:hypothetical protein
MVSGTYVAHLRISYSYCYKNIVRRLRIMTLLSPQTLSRSYRISWKSIIWFWTFKPGSARTHTHTQIWLLKPNALLVRKVDGTHFAISVCVVKFFQVSKFVKKKSATFHCPCLEDRRTVSTSTQDGNSFQLQAPTCCAWGGGGGWFPGTH